MDLGLQGRTAVITGGSMGIGKSVAEGLAAESVNVVLLARGKEALEEAAAEIQSASGVDVLSVPTDVTDAASVNAAAAATAERFGTVEILVNTAGGRMRRPDRQILWEDSDWLGDIDIKTIGMLRTVRAFLPHMDTTGRGCIINVAGLAGVIVWEGAMTHGINNAAMTHIGRYLARDLAGDNIRVNTVAPGLIASEWRESAWAPMMAEKRQETVEEFLAWYADQMGILVGRWGSMQEVADVVVFLASDRAGYINGAMIDIDGGQAINPRPPSSQANVAHAPNEDAHER
ncbi:MAG TPA: SDR family oxidoreductase [Acidimicrobiia bacterium]